MKKIGRNDPCPCGSGKKYKKCCINSETTQLVDEPTFMEEKGTPNAATDFINSFKAAVGDSEFESMDELKASLEAFQIASNEAPQMDFLGLSAEQMFRIRNNPLSELTQIVELEFPFDKMEYKQTPAVVIAANILLSIVIEGPWRATGKGNLPLRMVQNINENIGDSFLYPHPNPRSEEDLPNLWVMRNLMEFSGLIELVGRTFELTDLGAEMLSILKENDSVARLYRRLLLSYTDKFNWLVGTDLHDEFSDVQHTAPFCLYILHKKANEFTSEDVLAKVYARAFPITGKLALDAHPELKGRIEPKSLVETAFTDLFLYNYCWMFGLLEQSDGDAPSSPPKYRTTDLFRSTFKWKV